MKIHVNRFYGSMLLMGGISLLTFLLAMGDTPDLNIFWTTCYSLLISGFAYLMREPIYIDLENKQIRLKHMLWGAREVYHFESLAQLSIRSNDFILLCLKLEHLNGEPTQFIRILKAGLHNYDVQKLIQLVTSHSNN